MFTWLSVEREKHELIAAAEVEGSSVNKGWGWISPKDMSPCGRGISSSGPVAAALSNSKEANWLSSNCERSASNSSSIVSIKPSFVYVRTEIVLLSTTEARVRWHLFPPKAIHHDTSRLHTSVWSLRFLHHLWPAALGGVNHIETFTSLCNLYTMYIYNVILYNMLRMLMTFTYIVDCVPFLGH